MFITSSNNPLSASDGHLPISIFCFKDEKKFIRISDNYEETVERVVNSFHIQPGQSVLLQTSSYTACRGSPVVIDSSAYPLLWSLLEEVEVVVATESVPEKGEVLKVAIDSDVVKQQFITTPTSPVAGPSRDGLGTEIQDVRPTPLPINASEDELQEDEVRTEAVQTPPPQSDPLFHWDDEIQQGINQGEQVEEPPSTPQPKLKFKAAPTPTTKSAPDVSPMIKKEKQKEMNASVRLELSTIIDNPSKKFPRSAADDDTRFDVGIVGPDDDIPTQFKLRGRNSVRKVLIAACKNFDVDPNRAYLVMELNVEGETQTRHYFVCSPDDTMAMCGINADSKLFVRVNPATEDDPDDDSSD